MKTFGVSSSFSFIVKRDKEVIKEKKKQTRKLQKVYYLLPEGDIKRWNVFEKNK